MASKINPFPFSDTNKRYHTYNYFLRQKFGSKCVKIPLDGGFDCPNADGSRGFGGCTYCTGRFSPDSQKSITEQFDEAAAMLEKKWPGALYIPYFQARTNTYAPLEVLREKYSEALAHENVVGLNIATRADCLEDDVVEYLKELSEKTFLTVELGLQTVHDTTAERINRCHTYEEFLSGYEKLRGLNVCIHIIDGLPGEDREMMLQTAREIAALHPHALKIHLLYVMRGTLLAKQYEAGEFELLTLPQYVDIICSQLELLPPDIVIGRVTGDGEADGLIAPLWTRKKFVCMNEIDKELARRNSYQGILL